MMTDPAVTEVRELARLTQPDRLVEGKHACPVEGCGLSAEEHHALGQGTRDLMQRVRELESGGVQADTESSDSEVVFDMVERLVARGYRVSVSIELPGGGGMTLQGEPDGPATAATQPDGACAAWNAQRTFWCTLPSGHRGQHAAINQGQVRDRWGTH